MIKKNRIYIFLTIITMALLIWFTYQSMLSLGFEWTTAMSYEAIIKLAIDIMAVIVIIISVNRTQSGFSILWLCWSIWLLIYVYIFGMGGRGVANLFHVTFCPMVFLLFYTMSLYCEKIKQIGLMGFIIIYVIACYLNITNLTQILSVTLGEDSGVTNLVFWCLCALPFLLLFEKRWIQIVFLGATFIIVLLTGKRSAMISMLLIFVVYLFFFSRGRHNIWGTCIVLGFIIALFFIVSHFFEGSYIGAVERMNSMKEDQGSGRIQIYVDVYRELKNNTLVDWIIGRGCNSITLTRHSNAHNDALQMLFEFGFIGLLMYFVMIFHIIKRTIILHKAQSAYYLAYAASVIITIVLGLVSNLVVFYSYFAFICAFWGIVEARLVADKQIKIVLIS